MSLSSVPFQVSLADGAKLEGQRYGDGPPLVLISGLGGTGAFWHPVIQHLTGYTCIVFDQRGIGNSTRGSSAVTVHQLALDTLALLDTLQLEQPILVGHSTGGCIAMECTLSAPTKVAALVLSGTWAGPNDYMTRLFNLRSQLLQLNPALYQDFNPYLSYPPKWLLKNTGILSTTKAADWDDVRISTVQERITGLLAFDQRERLQTLTKPTLVLGAHDDHVVPSVLQYEILDLMPSTNTYDHFFNHGGHFYPISRASAFTDKITQWLRQI